MAGATRSAPRAVGGKARAEMWARQKVPKPTRIVDNFTGMLRAEGFPSPRADS
jgi:hypothetical protein